MGIIGSENNPANLFYFGVLMTGFLGAIIARFKPRGMMFALIATAIAQALVPVIAFIVFRPALDDPPGIAGVFILNGFFVALFAVAAILFRRAAQARSAEKRPIES